VFDPAGIMNPGKVLRVPATGANEPDDSPAEPAGH